MCPPAFEPASHDFSEQECGEFINAIFGLEKEDETAEESTEADTAPVEEDGSEVQYASYIDKLIAVEQLVPVVLPEEIVPDRVEDIAFSHEGFNFSLRIEFFGEQMCVLCYDGQGQQLCFMSGMSLEEYDAFVEECLRFQELE